MENIVYKLTAGQQAALFDLLFAACQKKDITAGFAAVRSEQHRNIIELLKAGKYSHASGKDLLELSAYLEVAGQAEEILSKAEHLSGKALDIYSQVFSSQ